MHFLVIANAIFSVTYYFKVILVIFIKRGITCQLLFKKLNKNPSEVTLRVQEKPPFSEPVTPPCVHVHLFHMGTRCVMIFGSLVPRRW